MRFEEAAAQDRRWAWRKVWQHRLRRHWLLDPAPRERMLEVVSEVCGIHAQVAASAQLSLGLRVDGVTHVDVRAALWQERSLVKTYALRGTLHLLPTRELPLWIAALRARVPPRSRTATDRNALSDERRAVLVDVICTALAGRVLTRQELHAEIERGFGEWATAPTIPAFGGQWPRWLLALQQAALDGLIVFGPNHGTRVTYVRTEDWVGPLDAVDGEAALRDVCRRFLLAYGPATHREFARWFATSPEAAANVMRSLDLEAIDVEGWRGWLPRGAADEASEEQSKPSVLLMPQFDCYAVGAFPRDQLIPSAPAPLRQGTAAPFSVVLIDGIVGGLWQRCIHGRRLEVRVDTFAQLSRRQVSEVYRQAERVGKIFGLQAEVSFGHVQARGHL